MVTRGYIVWCQVPLHGASTSARCPVCKLHGLVCCIRPVQVSEVVRANGELVIGVVDSLGRVSLGEKAFGLESFGPEDRLVVLADE